MSSAAQNAPHFPRGTSGQDACEADHCITCADEGVPMRVVEAEEAGLALCAAEDGDRAEVMTDLVGDVRPGDSLLVHAGVALARLA